MVEQWLCEGVEGRSNSYVRSGRVEQWLCEEWKGGAMAM